MSLEVIVLGLVNLVGAGFLWFLKDAYNEMKRRVEKLEDTAMKKDDFTEFKRELFSRLDRFEDQLKRGHE